MNIDLSGKRVIVTGASRGIGRAIAQAFATEGARVAICARSEEAVIATGKALEATAQAVIARAVDVTDTEGVKAFVAEIVETWGGVDVLINNAGQGKGGNLDTLTPEAILEHANNHRQDVYKRQVFSPRSPGARRRRATARPR